MAGALIFEDYDDFCHQVANHIISILRHSLVHNRRASMVLSGGNTRRGVYKTLAEEHRDFSWQFIDFFVGDERCVPEDHKDSNVAMIRRHFLDKLDLGETRIYTINATLSPEQGARDYHRVLKEYLERNGHFDLVLLGIGLDGHTASLFPGAPELDETKRLVLATRDEAPLDPYHHRVTMTLPALNHSSHLLFLLRGGQEKRRIMDQVLHPKGSSPYPAQLIHPEKGRVYWYFSE